MGLSGLLFGAPVDPESVPDGPVAAFPHTMTVSGWPARIVTRFWYSPHPRHADDLPAVHRALVRFKQAPAFAARYQAAPLDRRGRFALRVPAAVAGPVPVWARDVAVPVDRFPTDQFERAEFCPFWLRFESPARVRFEIEPAGSVGARARQRLDAVRRRGGVAVRAAVIQANAALYEPGPDDLPCLVLFGFDERVGDDELQAIAQRVFALKNTEPRDPEQAAVAALTTDETFVYYQRDRLPRSVAGRRELFAGHLYVHRPFLAGRHLRGQVLDCLAEPGERGMLELLPPHRAG